jgi:hypothetical protein
LVPILALFALLIVGGVYWAIYVPHDQRDVLEFNLYFPGWPSFYLGLGIGIAFGFWARHTLGLSLLALAAATFGSGLALAIQYPDTMSAPAVGILVLILSAVPLTTLGVFFSVLPSSRWLALTAALAALVLTVPAVGMSAAAFAFR